MKFLAFFLVAASTAACVEPEVGPPLRATCNGADSDPARDIDYARDIDAAIFKGDGPHCQRCHTPGFGTPIGVALGGLDLSSYETLRRGGVQSHEDIIVPGDPCASVLLQKVSAAPPFGARMPLDGPPYVDAEKIQVLSDWIAEGAHAE